MKSENRAFAKKFGRILCAVLVLAAATGGRSYAEESDYLSPISVAAGDGGNELYVAEYTGGQIAVFDVACGKVTRRIPVGANPVGLEISRDGSQLYVSCATADGGVYIVDIADGKVGGRIGVGHTPVGVVLSPDGKTLYVCNQFSNNIGVVDLELRKQVAIVNAAREPVAAALTTDGRFLFVANHLPAGAADADYVASVVSVIDTNERKVVKDIELPNGSTNLRGITISPDGQYAYVTHVLGRYQFPVTYLEKGWINTNAMSIIDVPSP
jgi:YVTN family beta-propeller protein